MDAVQTPWCIVYADGSGNNFRFSRQRAEDAVLFTYDPVQPAASSSGTYSGGQAQRGVVDAAEVVALWRLVEHLAADTALHTEVRRKGTGALSVAVGDVHRDYICNPGARLDALHDFLAPYRAHRVAGAPSR